MIPEFGSLGFDPGTFVVSPAPAQKVDEGGPGAGDTGGVAKIVFYFGWPCREFVQQLLVSIDRLLNLSAFCVVICLGLQGMIGMRLWSTTKSMSLLIAAGTARHIRPATGRR